MIHFLYICIEINDIIKWFSSKVAVCILQIFILVFIIDAYFCIQREKNMVYISVVLHGYLSFSLVIVIFYNL